MENVKTGFIEITSHDPELCFLLLVLHTRFVITELGGTRIFLDLRMPIRENRNRRPNRRKNRQLPRRTVFASSLMSVVTYLAVVQSL